MPLVTVFSSVSALITLQAVMSAVNEMSTCSMRMNGTGRMVSSGTTIIRFCPPTTNVKVTVSGSKDSVPRVDSFMEAILT